MRYMLIIVIVALFMNLHAKESYPKLFFKLGTPLYKATNSLKAIDKVPEMKTVINTYVMDAKAIKESGFQADTAEEKKAYFKSLRGLQSKHDELIGISTKIVYKAMKEDNYAEFTSMINFGISYYEKRPNLREKVLAYYKKNRTKSKIVALEKLLRYDRSVTKLYDESEHTYAPASAHNYAATRAQKDIILLSSSGCGWCTKLKTFLNKNSISYRELSVGGTEGARLYRKYNGRGVPMTIINNKVIRGYNPEKIMEEIQ